MNKNEQNVYEAKQSIKAHIKFLEVLLSHLKGSDQILKRRAMWASWCIHRYLNDRLVADIESAIRRSQLGGEDAKP